MRLRLPPYLLLILAACAGTEVGNPTFACGADTASKSANGGGGTGGLGGNGGEGQDRTACEQDGSDCGLAVSLGSFADAACPGGASRTLLWLGNLTDRTITGRVQVSDDATVEVTPDAFAIEPHGEALLPVVFAPPDDASAGADGATLWILIDGDPPGAIQVQLHATVDPMAPPALNTLCGNAGPCQALEFGEVDVGATAEAPLALVNDGCVEQTLLAPELGADGQLALVDPPAFPLTLPERASLALRVAFTPAATGPTGGTVTIRTTAGATHAVPWQGSGR